MSALVNYKCQQTERSYLRQSVQTQPGLHPPHPGPGSYLELGLLLASRLW